MNDRSLSDRPAQKGIAGFGALTLLLGLLVGAAIGISGYTFFYAEGFSYFQSDPEVCTNCHLMRDHFNAWTRSSHHHAAVCVDCHMPHNLAGKLAVKAINGYRHTWAFTSGRHPDNLMITPLNRAVTEARCRSCHRPIVEAIDTLPAFGMELDCIRCHASVGHLE